MKRYKLLKDLPGLEKGTILSQYGSALGLRILVTEAGGAVTNFFSNEMFEKFFEEIEESTDSIHWKPEQGDEYFWIDECGSILPGTFYRGALYDCQRLTFGNVYRTEKEAEKARDRRLAEVRLRRTSTFEPDFENGKGGYVIFYNPEEKKLETHNVYCYDYGEIVRYETVEEAEKSIKENREDWLIYFGIKEEK